MPIFTIIGTAIAGALFAGSALAASLISAGLALAAKLALSYLSRPKKKAYAAVQGEVQLGGDYPASAVYGKAKLKGHRDYSAHWGAGNRYRAEVLILSNGRCDGLEPELYFYGEKHALTAQAVIGGEHARYFVDGFNSNIEIRFYDGRPGQAADAALVAATATTGNPWSANARHSGLCYAIVIGDYDTTLFDKGVPEYEFVLRGLREYDPRYDSTVPGGSGAQRLATPSTWVWTQNPAVHRLNYLLGIKGLISGRTLIGVGMDISQIDVASHMVAATVCDATRTVGARTIPTYAASLIVAGDDDHIEILAEFEDAMAGYSANMSGLSGVIAGAPQVVASTLTANDIRVDDVLDVSYRRSGQDSVNILSGQFISTSANWTPASLTTVTVNADVTMDGRKRLASNDFLQVTDPDIGQYLLNIRYRQNRKAGKASIPVSRRFGAKTSLGDWISWNGKTWLVSGRSFDARMRFRLDLSETGADIYSEAGITPGPVVVPPSVPQNPSLISTVAGFGVAVGLIGDAAGIQRPTLQFTWTAPNDPTITQVRFFYRKVGTTEEFETVSTSPNSGVHRTSTNIMGNTAYEARATITTVPDRLKTFTAWSSSGPTGIDTSVSFGLVNAQDDALHLYENVHRDISDLRSLVEQVAHDAGAVAAQNFVDRRELRSDIGNALASISEEQYLRISQDDALALQITSVNAAYNSVTASVTEEILTRATADTALAGQITTLSVAMGEYSAEGLMGWVVQAGGSGVSARFALEGRVNSGAGWVTGGMYMEILSGGSRRVVFDVDNFTITSSVGTEAPFTYDSGLGLVLIKNAYIRNLTSSNITAGSVMADSLNADVATFMELVAQSVDIDFAHIQNVVIDTGLIAANAITSADNDAGTTFQATPSASYNQILSVAVESPSSNPVRFYYKIILTASTSASSATVRVRITHNGSEIVLQQINITSGGGSGSINVSQFIMVPVTAAGTQTFVMQTYATNAPQVSISGASFEMIAECNKK